MNMWILLFPALLLGADEAKVYRWVDAAGGVYISNTLKGVPERYRIHATPMKLEIARENPGPGKRPVPKLAMPDQIPFSLPKRLAVKADFNTNVKRDALLDSGSEITIITTKLASALNIKLSKARSETLLTPSGRVTVPVVVLDNVKIGNAEVSNIEAAVMDFAGRGEVSAVIGMNFLSRFVFEINSTNELVAFTRLSGN